MLSFLTQLFESGDIVVPRQSITDNEQVIRYLCECELIYRSGWHGTTPEFDVSVAIQAASALLLFCQAIVYRELDEAYVCDKLAEINLPADQTDSNHYSADLILRFLPDVYDRLQRTTSEDPLLPVLVDFARLWPLSSIGISDTATEKLPECLLQKSLFGTYVDRVIQRRDVERCSVVRVADAVNAAIGDHRFLAPQLADELTRPVL